MVNLYLIIISRLLKIYLVFISKATLFSLNMKECLVLKYAVFNSTIFPSL